MSFLHLKWPNVHLMYCVMSFTCLVYPNDSIFLVLLLYVLVSLAVGLFILPYLISSSQFRQQPICGTIYYHEFGYPKNNMDSPLIPILCLDFQVQIWIEHEGAVPAHHSIWSSHPNSNWMTLHMWYHLLSLIWSSKS